MAGRLLKRAYLYFDNGRPEEAEREAALVIASEPDNFEAHGIFAYARMLQGRHDDARKSAERAVHLAPDQAWTQFVAGSAFAASGMNAQATRFFEQALRIDPTRTETYASLAQLRFMDQRFADSLDLTTRGLALDPQSTVLLNVHAEALSVLGRNDEAEEALRLSMKIEPENAETLSVLARLRSQQKQHGEAEQLFRSALRAAPADKLVQRELAAQMMLRNPVLSRAQTAALWIRRMSKGRGFWVLVLGGIAVNLALRAAGIRVSISFVARLAVALISAFSFAAWAMNPGHRDAKARALTGARRLSWPVGALLGTGTVCAFAALFAGSWIWMALFAAFHGAAIVTASRK